MLVSRGKYLDSSAESGTVITALPRTATGCGCLFFYTIDKFPFLNTLCYTYLGSRYISILVSLKNQKLTEHGYGNTWYPRSTAVVHSTLSLVLLHSKMTTAVVDPRDTRVQQFNSQQQQQQPPFLHILSSKIACKLCLQYASKIAYNTFRQKAVLEYTCTSRIFEDFDWAPVLFIQDVQRKTYEILL